MSVLQALGTGTLPQWGTFITILTIFVGMVTVFIRGIPERLRAKTEDRRSLHQECMEQLKEVRAEVHECQREIGKLEARLRVAEALSQRRGHHISNMLFIIRLLMNELRRLDPNSNLLAQAESLLALLEHEDMQSVSEARVMTEHIKDAP